ncbi:MAG: hypothetical protein WCD39_04675 [Methyloceanibacter sp.]
MRDIRSDLQERVTLVDEQIRAACTYFENTAKQLQNERDARIADLKSCLAMIAKFMDFEQRFLANASAQFPSSPLPALADLFMHKLNEAGSMSREELVELAVKEGFFPDAEQAVQGVHPMLKSLLRSELIRELPNGTFAPPTMSQAIKVRRAV